MKTSFKHSLVAATVIVALSVFTGCTGGGSSDESVSNHDLEDHNEVVIEGTDLACAGKDSGVSAIAATMTADKITRVNLSRDSENSQERPNAQNNLKRLSAVVTSTAADGTVSETNEKVHPLVVSYAEQVIGDYEMGDGSADIGDPYHVDDIFLSLSLDNGKTWKKLNLSNTADKSSIKVAWGNGVTTPNLDYPGHSHKPTMQVEGNRILVAWNDKYCPSGNPLDLQQADDGSYPDDLYKVNGSQGSINYNLTCTIADDPTTPNVDESDCAPNGKEVYEVPFSCAWTARGIFDPEAGEITWQQAKQLTTGTRDSNKLWIAASSDVGFAMSWQEDPEGLREGKGAGPGEGWSGATTNHGADIWYSYLKMDDFDAVEPLEEGEDNETKPKSLNNFTYPVRVTDNEVCLKDDTKLYCQEIHCTSYVTSNQGDTEKCVTKTLDPLWDDGTTTVILDGDTGASRPALSILKTNEGEPVVVLAYEETKGLAESDPGVPNQDQDADVDSTDIAVEGKVAYFESFLFDKPVTVSPGSIVNLRAPAQDGSGDMIYENARRVVLVNQVDPCDEGKYTFGILYKQGVETRGGSSDMFLRMNTGFKADTFEKTVTNVSAMDSILDENGTAIDSTWSSANLDDYSYENLFENTFSPRGFMRGDDIYIGFEYTPNYAQSEQGNVPNTFYIHRNVEVDGTRGWQGPQQISKVVGRKISTLDPRFFPTPKGTFDKTGLESDKSNPDVLFLTYGTYDMESGLEEDLFYTRSTDKGATWETVDLNTSDGTIIQANAKLAGVKGIEEKEVQTVPTPDGTAIYNVWLQEQDKDAYEAGTEVLDEDGNVADHFRGLDSWMGRVDYNVTAEAE